MIKIKALLAKMLTRLNLLGDLQLKGWVNVTSSASQTFTHNGVFRGVLVAIGNNANTVCGMYLVNSTSGTSVARNVVSASQLTVTPSYGSIAVSSGVSTACHLFMVCLEGTGEWT